ncbi:MAG: class I SAM-dependent methyltransferase [Eubacteriales bacterium]|nr:class I SAM-dependent methyltransferase [Eubacteriales bacterium]
MWIANEWKDYEVIDTGNGDKLERWDRYILRRPDPQVIWPIMKDHSQWKKVDGHYHRSEKGGGHWDFFSHLPEQWTVSYKDLAFYIKPLGFKHTGLFPEQAVNWDWMIEKIKSSKTPVRVLNLFAYTGGATVAAAYGGAEEVCHVDAAKGMVSWAKENLQLSKLSNKKVRFIVDDVVKFVQREIRRGNKYEAIIMDPPSYGRGPKGEIWKIEEKLYELIELCMQVMSDTPLFFIINSYTTGLAPTVLKDILTLSLANQYEGKVTADEIGLPISESGLILPCGATGRWEI